MLGSLGSRDVVRQGPSLGKPLWREPKMKTLVMAAVLVSILGLTAGCCNNPCNQPNPCNPCTP